MIDGEFKGGQITLYERNPHGRWSIQYHIRYGSGIGQFRHNYSYFWVGDGGDRESYSDIILKKQQFLVLN